MRKAALDCIGVLVKTLRTGRSLRRTRRTTERRGRLAAMVNIALRPPEVLDLVVAGHRDGDLITGKENKSSIGTLVERSTGFVMLLHLPNNHGALPVGEATIEAMNRLPRSPRRTLTWDQGLEMANAVVARTTRLDIYFCDPHSPWHRVTTTVAIAHHNTFHLILIASRIA